MENQYKEEPTFEICNQFFVKDTHRDKRYPATIRCSCCDRVYHYINSFPFSINDIAKWMERTTQIHDFKGCNEKQLPDPEWASKEVEFTIITK